MIPCNDQDKTKPNDGCCTKCKECDGTCPGCGTMLMGLCEICAGTGNTDRDASDSIHRPLAFEKKDENGRTTYLEKDDVQTLITQQRVEAYVNRKWVLVKERKITEDAVGTEHKPSWRIRFATALSSHDVTANILLSESDNLIRVLNCNDGEANRPKCDTCKGHGMVSCDCPSEMKCSACEGDAYIMNVTDCEQCKGSGRTPTNEWTCDGSTKAVRVKPAVKPMAQMKHAELISWAIRELKGTCSKTQTLSAKIKILKEAGWDGKAMMAKKREDLSAKPFYLEGPETIQVIMAKTMNVDHALALTLTSDICPPEVSDTRPLEGFQWLTAKDMEDCTTCGGDGLAGAGLVWGTDKECTACVGRESKREGACGFGPFWAQCKKVPQQAQKQERKCSKSPYSRLLTDPDLEKDYIASKPPCNNPKCKNGWIEVKWWPDHDCPDCEINTKCQDCKGDNCESCGGSGLVDIPKWEIKTRKFLNNGNAKAALKDACLIAKVAATCFVPMEVVTDLRNQYQKMKIQKKKYDRLVLEGKTEEAAALWYNMKTSAVKDTSVTAVCAAALMQGIRYNSAKDFVDTVGDYYNGDAEWNKVMGGLGDMALDFIR